VGAAAVSVIVTSGGEPSAVEELARLQLQQMRAKERSQKNGRIGCLAIVVILGFAVFMSSIFGGRGSGGKYQTATVNNVSRFAREAHLIFEADAAASADIPAEASAGNYAQAYADADRAATVLNEATNIEAPPGFERTRDALRDYAQALSDSFRRSPIL